MFSIDSTQGLIYVEQSLDREVYPKIIYTVLASDNVQPKPLTGTAIVEINVIDVNDNDPAFSPLEFHFTVLTITTAVLLRVGVPLSDAMTENVYLGVVSLSK
jgi:hypothetical protein